MKKGTRELLGALSQDLYRVALGYHRGLITMANRFYEEALKRREEIDQNSLKPYLRKLLAKLDTLISQEDKGRIAEDALMYSTLFQNASLQ